MEPIPTVTPKTIVSFEPDEFTFVFSLAVHAGHLNIPASRRMFGPLEKEPDGPYLRLTNTPLNRAAAAVLDHYDGDAIRFQSFMFRFMAFLDLAGSGELAPWMRQSETDPEAQEIHPAVIEVAGRLPLTSKGKFPKRFSRVVAKLASEKYC
jgi:hypothetical protein